MLKLFKSNKNTCLDEKWCGEEWLYRVVHKWMTLDKVHAGVIQVNLAVVGTATRTGIGYLRITEILVIHKNKECN